MMECLVDELAAVGSNLVRVAVRLRFFDRVITPVALFASGHRTIRMSDLYKLDVVFRKMLRMIVGPPSFVEWKAPWHEILHHWNGKAVALAQQHGLNPWSEQCLKYHCFEPVGQTRGETNKYYKCTNVTESGRYCSQRALSWAATCHSPIFCHLQIFVTGASHKSKDRPRLPPPAFYVSARFSHPLSRDNGQWSTLILSKFPIIKHAPV